MADTLFGDMPFTGRLPLTWAKSMAQLPINVGDASYDPRTRSAGACGPTRPRPAWSRRGPG